VDNFERTAGLRAALLGLHAFAQIILIAALAFTVRKFNQFYINRNQQALPLLEIGPWP
jgi:hypothetical protein